MQTDSFIIIIIANWFTECFRFAKTNLLNFTMINYFIVKFYYYKSPLVHHSIFMLKFFDLDQASAFDQEYQLFLHL